MASTVSLYAVVGNIPQSYHSSDLRNFFSRFIEKNGFHCFHFRHRPEGRRKEKMAESALDDTTRNKQDDDISSKQNPEVPVTCCCVIRLPESQYRDFVQMYDCRHWITQKGDSMKRVCRIVKIKTSSKSTDDHIEPQYKTRLEQSLVSPDREEFHEEDLKNLIELNPPTVMPKGNVGTPTVVFLDLIRQCLLPPKIISKLKLKFPKTAIDKKYGNVPFDYQVYNQPELGEENTDIRWLPVKSGSGHELLLDERAAREDEPEESIDSLNRGEKDVRGVVTGIVEGYAVGVEQRMLGSLIISDSGQAVDDRKVEEKRRRNLEGEEEKLVKGRGGIEEEEASNHEDLDEENRKSSNQREGTNMLAAIYEDKRGQCGENGSQRGEMDEEMDHIGKENGDSESVKETEDIVAQWNRTEKYKINQENIKLFKEGIRQSQRLGILKIRETLEENVEVSDNKNADDGESSQRRQRESEKQKAKLIKKQEIAARRKKMALRIEEKMIEFERGSDHSEDDADECEEWERHEALHDDPSNQERNEERLFEQEIELKWEKGGSGLVFYTDAQFWKQQEGDFDEQTADDWDVDMSGYYQPGAGDMDGRDLIRIRRDQRRRECIDDEDGMVAGIGKFEKHTKGFGRKIMERHGWKDGEGLGSSTPGIAEALLNDGQNPHCKMGFGFQLPKHGKRTSGFYKRRELREWHGPIISTVYDDPSVTDPAEPLLRRNEPYQLKRRKNNDVS